MAKSIKQFIKEQGCTIEPRGLDRYRIEDGRIRTSIPAPGLYSKESDLERITSKKNYTPAGKIKF